jgi:hypothetical protein
MRVPGASYFFTDVTHRGSVVLDQQPVARPSDNDVGHYWHIADNASPFGFIDGVAGVDS